MKIISSSVSSVWVLFRNRPPSRGIFQRPGIMFCPSLAVSLKIPAIMPVPPSRTIRRSGGVPGDERDVLAARDRDSRRRLAALDLECRG